MPVRVLSRSVIFLLWIFLCLLLTIGAIFFFCRVFFLPTLALAVQFLGAFLLQLTVACLAFDVGAFLRRVSCQPLAMDRRHARRIALRVDWNTVPIPFPKMSSAVEISCRAVPVVLNSPKKEERQRVCQYIAMIPPYILGSSDVLKK